VFIIYCMTSPANIMNVWDKIVDVWFWFCKMHEIPQFWKAKELE
jgi:hypothetical protein